VRITINSDDVEQQLPSQNNTILRFSPDLDFLNGRYVGLRFEDVGIAQGAPILHAHIQFTTAPGSTQGPLTVSIKGEAVDFAQDFDTAPGSLGALFANQSTTAAVDWSPPNWNTVGEAGPDQLTPDLAPILQEIVNRPGWVEGNPLALLIAGTAGSALRKAYSFDGLPEAAAVLSIDYLEANPSLVSLRNLQVCVPQALNANEGGSGFTDPDLVNDCTMRVQQTLSDLALACHYPSMCTCSVVDNSQQWSQTCDNNGGVCAPSPVDCKDFQKATNFPGDDPVCTANSPLAADIFGHRSTCVVTGTAHVAVGDDAESSHAAGIVQFDGRTCPGASCAVGMDYRLSIDPVTFGNFFDSETFSDLGGVGETLSDAVVSPTGDGSFAPTTAAVSAQGRRGGGSPKGLAATNDNSVGVNVGWGNAAPTCSLTGALLGNVDPEASACDEGPDAGKPCHSDEDCAQVDSCSDGVCNCVKLGTQNLSLSLDLTGTLINQPPTANAGPDQSVECTRAALTNIVLDATRSSDPDGNIAVYSWLRGDLDGPEVGFDPMSKVEQALGAQTYVLRVIDALGQADEVTTLVDVVDTTPPVLTCSVATSVINQTNHNLINVGLSSTANDQCEGALPVTVNVFGNEDDEENGGDGHFSPDATDIAPGTLRLRAERSGNGNGRVYLIIPEATDSSGNRGFSCCTVTVPVSASKAAQTSAVQQAAAAQAFCLANNGTAPAAYFVIGDGAVLGPKQ
jgi:hypothetical protein